MYVPRMSASVVEVPTVRVELRLRTPGVLHDAGSMSIHFVHETSGAGDSP